LTAPLADPDFKALAFEGTVQNEAIQSWLLSLYSKKAIAKERQQPTQDYTRALDRFETALRLVYGGDVRRPGVALILDIDLKLREQPSVADEVSIL
jgi:hypothetical protein